MMQISQPRSQRQHFLPRFLLKGFASRATKDAFYVHLFRKGCQPFEVNILNVGVARDFYESPSAGGLESKLSVQEGEYALLLDNLRNGVIDQTEKGLLVDLVCNLMVRTKHLRDGFKEAGENILDSLEQQLGDLKNRWHVERLFAEKAIENPELRRVLKSLPRKQRRKLISQTLKQLGVDIPTGLRLLLKLARKHVSMNETVKKAQARSLAIDNALAERKESMKNFRWCVEERPAGTFVLGDVGPIVRFPDSVELKAPLGFGMPELILLPVSDRQLLVGRKKGSRRETDDENLNLASVELSRDFFVASGKTKRELSYLERIGRRATLIDEAEMNRSMQEALRTW
jgi:hypothetical protein